MKAKYIGLFAVILIFGIIFVPKIHDRIVNNTIVDNTRMSTAKSQEADVVVDTSKKLLALQEVPAFDFINQDSQAITNDFYKGKVYVVEFFFSSCTTICPIMNRNMLQVSQEFASQENFGIASISIDPSFDTPQVLKAYASRYKATHPNWNFLTGDKDTIHKLSNEGFKLFAAQDKDEIDGFSHSGLFALIDQNGVVRSRKDKHGNPLFYYNGLEQESIDMLIQDIKKLL
ncbi:SCO family protein [Flavobacteriaceae bacterium]|jgi:protein SCO1/2|nr:SCO family protein [Flavobacteriaceae bacterium]MDB4324929.1 SCO family protein [Flavobacteriaceae bacterium]